MLHSSSFTARLDRIMTNHPFSQFNFIRSCAALNQLPADEGVEVAFIGRSNAGKSSAINAIANRTRLAHTSKTPGRTQMMNVFAGDDDEVRLIDLPGYGYAKVPRDMLSFWQQTLPTYFAERESLCGLFLIMDIRHPLKESDRQMLYYLADRQLPTHILLTKADRYESYLYEEENRNNNIIRQVAADFKIPLVDFDIVADTLPNRGLKDDNIHLNGPLQHDYNLEEAYTKGHTVHNLAVLLMMERIREEVIGN